MSSSKVRITLRADGEDGYGGQDGVDGFSADNLHGTDGSDATEPQAGEDGQDITLTLATLENESGQKMVQVYATTPHKGVLWDEIYSLNSVPTIRWSTTGGDGGKGARGGRGGKGAPGADGVDATPPDISGSNGEPGGNGGKGGAGSSGAKAGNGGNVKVMIKEKDLYLLMMVDPCKFRNTLLAGGQGGKSEGHGLGGVGGAGGRGGKALSVASDVNKKKKTIIPGGTNGITGADGLAPVWKIDDGENGTRGTFSIELIDGKDEESFEARYTASFENLELEGSSPMANPSECEFGDVISIRNIKIKNTGQMPLPTNQEIHFCIKDVGHPNVSPLISRKDAFLPTGKTCASGEFAMSQGELKFFAGFPGEVDDEYDFNPLKQTANFHIQAFQYGPIKLNGKERTSDFKKEYKEFHSGDGSTLNLTFSPGDNKSTRAREEGVAVNLRYPIENGDGLRAPQSLCPGEETVVSLALDNVGADDLGGFNVDDTKNSPRRVAVRYFYLRSSQYDMSSDMVHCSTHPDKSDGITIDLVNNPKLHDVPAMAPGESYDFKTRLALGREVPPYSRMALIVDVFLQTLPLPKGIKIEEENHDTDKRMPSMSVVQRRKLDFICEPRYEEREDAKVVLVTSYATTRIQYETWTQYILAETLNVDYEVYSVSRYGSLDPTFVPENGKTLRDAFRNKLIVVLTEKFKENARDKEAVFPLELLPNGCMQQTSGYEPSTRWLVVGVNETLNKRLLQQHLATEPEETGDFPDIATYQKHIQKLADDRATRGRERDDLRMRVDTINIVLTTSKEGKAAQKLLKAAESLAEFLKQEDPLNQYTIEYFDHDFSTQQKGIIKRKRSYLEVRRGFCRSLNSVVCVAGKYCAEPKQIKSNGVIMSIAEAMSRETRVAFLAGAIRNNMPDKVITAFKYACISEMIRDSSVFLDSKMKMNDDLELSFPSIGSLLDSVEMLVLIRDCKTSQELKNKTCEELSDLLARLELVANSKDLRPRFSLIGVSTKKTTLEAMSEIVGRLRVQWKTVISNTRIEEVKKALKLEIKDFLKEDTGKKTLNYRSDKRWIQGLNYVHSTENDAAFGIANASKRLIEFDLDEQVDNYKIPPPSVRVYSSNDMRVLREEVAFGQERCNMIANNIRLKRQFSVLAPFCRTEI